MEAEMNKAVGADGIKAGRWVLTPRQSKAYVTAVTADIVTVKSVGPYAATVQYPRSACSLTTEPGAGVR